MVVRIVADLTLKAGEITGRSSLEPRAKEGSKVKETLDRLKTEMTKAGMPEKELLLARTEVAIGVGKDGEIDLRTRPRTTKSGVPDGEERVVIVRKGQGGTTFKL